MRTFVTTALFLCVLAACRKSDRDANHKPTVYDSTPSPYMQKTIVTLDPTHKQNAWLQVPIHYNSGFDTEKYPLLVYFNGKFESGLYGGLEKLVSVGVPKFMADSIRFAFDTGAQKKQLIVLCPQSDNGFTSPAALNQLLDYMVANYRVDVSRIYLTGVSSGAASIFSYLTNKPEYAARVAAVVPMSSIALESEKVSNFGYIGNASVHTQIFCGDGDVLYQTNKDYAAEINTYNPGIALFTKFSGGHGDWNPVYDPSHKSYNPNIYEWMLKYHR